MAGHPKRGMGRDEPRAAEAKVRGPATYQRIGPEAGAVVGGDCSGSCELENFAGHKHRAGLRVRRHSGVGDAV